MKRIYVNEDSCLGCHLCEYYCAFANSELSDMAGLKGRTINPRIHVETSDPISFAVNCHHCSDPVCVKVCIAAALSKGEDGVVRIDPTRCVGCFSCVMVCPFGALAPSDDGRVMQKCELCTGKNGGSPACVAGRLNRAIVFEDRGEKPNSMTDSAPKEG